MNLSTLLGQYRLLSVMEGISYLLFALTMPLKYIWEIGTPNKIVGMAHGVLFIAFVIWTIVLHNDKKWGFKITLIAFICSLLPFGTFWLDHKFLKPLQKNS